MVAEAPQKVPAVVAAPPKAPVVAAAPQKAPVVIAQAAPPKPAPKTETPAREAKQERKPGERPDSAISISKRPPAGTPVAEPEKAAPRTAAAAPSQNATTGSISVERQDRDSPRPERASAEYRNAVDLMNQGRSDAAIDAFAGALRLDPKHAAARQSLVALLMGRGRGAEAQGVLREGLAVQPENTAWSMLLARLQIEAGDKAGALATLDTALPHAKNRPDYHAFVGTVLQLQGRHKDAIAHYEVAVRLSPDSGRWLTGLAISLEDEKRLPEARDAYQRALATNTLGPDLRAFVERKLGQLK
ncbi:MAG: tetratricopeptide repeat protein [Acidobacteriota bacterium]